MQRRAGRTATLRRQDSDARTVEMQRSESFELCSMFCQSSGKALLINGLGGKRKRCNALLLSFSNSLFSRVFLSNSCPICPVWR